MAAILLKLKGICNARMTLFTTVAPGATEARGDQNRKSMQQRRACTEKISYEVRWALEE
jgi:hypothetical protein